jgi:thioredoxin-dependent peroxiredoxin
MPERTVAVGDPLPEFSGRTDSGSTVGRAALAGRPAVLFFYPKAGSPGCSIESREFARRLPEFTAAGVRVVGVSVDSATAQKRFREKCDLPFDLIADDDGAISRQFGVLGGLGVARRTTFLIGADGRVLEVVRSWRPRRHAEAAIARLVRGAAGPAAEAAPEPKG